MDSLSSREIRAWLEREMALGLELLPREVALEAEEAPLASAAAQGPPVVASSAAALAPSPVAQKAAEVAAARSAFVDAPTARTSSLSEVLVEAEIRAASSLEALREVLGDCSRCKLCTKRTNIVFGVGNPKARIMFIGEGPGEDEDLRGEPFVGRAGELLDRIITNAMGLKRSEVYIANIVKCRPPGNRDPEPDEIVACEPFLRRQIELVGPEVLISLGKFATQALLGDRTPISRRRGNWYEVAGVPLMPTFHPAYLLRNPSDKGLVWSDIKLVMARLGLPLPKRGAGA